MYTLVSAIGKDVSENGIWTDFEIDNFILKDVFKYYSKIYITLYNPFNKKNEVLYLNDILNDINDYEGKFSEYLVYIGNKSLPTKVGELKLKRRVVRRSDLVKADWKMKPITQGGDPTSTINPTNGDWLFIEKDCVKPLDFYQYGMVSVNGFYHFIDASSQGIWIADGMRTVLQSNANHLSVLSFRELGKIKYVKITEDMIYKQCEDTSLFDQCFIHLKDIDTTKKTVLLVLGGYLHVADWVTYRKAGDNIIRLDIKNTPYIKRYHESKEFINTDYLGVEKGYTDDNVAISDLTSDEVIKKYLTGWHSFLVILDCDDIYVDKHSLMLLPSPGKYISHIKPIYPMVVGSGMAGEYWDIYDHDEWCVNLSYSQYHIRKYMTRDPLQLTAINGQNVPTKRADFSHAYLLEIGSVKPEFIDTTKK
jgi:hypothetical protein